MNWKIKALRIVVSTVLLLGLAWNSGAQTLKLPPHEKIVLKNGLTLLLMEKHGVPIVNFAVIVKGGAVADPSGQEGLASVTAGLLRKGTAKRSAQQFAADLDFIGAEFNADSSADYTAISGEFLSKDVDKGLELFSDAMLHPAFAQAEVEKLLAQEIDGIKAAKDEAQSVALNYYYGYLFSKHPYGWPVGSDELSLARVKHGAITKFYETSYAPGNTILAVAGEFNAAKMRAKIEQALGGWTAKPGLLPAIIAPTPVK